MEKRYSQFSEHELRQEITHLNDKAKKAEQMGMVNELAVYERKIVMAKSYLLNPDDFQPGESYELNDGEGTIFKISYMNGIFAWGHRQGNENREEEAFPIALLVNKMN
ncbi:YfhH family protein [Anaerobacillus sp. CMMVII]|uniref:YfhH family protein n=1 Tax=Anaerobacillus sp. CMMVII TaxID=2755588 RepID=UPI0021B8139F|nr:YfhH family protein [Anaerobacillus sp. CMMVII]MCT8136931.1 YfhH family protein [Anaerobacillus sp. CMMVII]